jgi:hypothetical protein
MTVLLEFEGGWCGVSCSVAAAVHLLVEALGVGGGDRAGDAGKDRVYPQVSC